MTSSHRPMPIGIVTTLPLVMLTAWNDAPAYELSTQRTDLGSGVRSNFAVPDHLSVRAALATVDRVKTAAPGAHASTR